MCIVCVYRQFGHFDYGQSTYGMDSNFGEQSSSYNPSILTPDQSQTFSAPPGPDSYDDEPPLMEGL